MYKIQKGKPILVTGGAGFIGSNLIKKLVKTYPGNNIISLDNYSSGSRKNHIVYKNIKYIKGDTRNLAIIWNNNKLKVPSVVFHLGEFARVDLSFNEPEKCIESNLMGTFEVIKFCTKHKIRLIYAGSSTKFGNRGEDKHLSPYSWVKATNTELIKNYSQWFGLDYVITYFYNVYGPNQVTKGDYATIIGIFERQYKKGQSLTVVKPGSQTRDFTHISDIVNGILICATRGGGDNYHLGTGREISILEVAKMFKSPGIKWLPARKGTRMRSKCPGTSKARKLGWKAKINLRDYIATFIKDNKKG
jgi:UDP-glucose 4-epimerase